MCHTIECRLNAEDQSVISYHHLGVITKLFIPGGHGRRWDSHI